MTDSSNLVHRGAVSGPDLSEKDTEDRTEQQQQQPVDDKQNFYFIYTSAKIIIVLLICISIYILYVLNFFETDKAISNISKATNTKGPHFGDPSFTGQMFTREELAKHDANGSPILLAIMGRVYDVTKGKSYHAGGSYPFFAGLDGTKAFATGEFNEEGLIDDITELDHDSILSIADWVNTYDEEYIFVGRLIGTYFDEKGEATPALFKAEKLLRNANRHKSLQQQEKVKFPPCNGRLVCMCKLHLCTDPVFVQVQSGRRADSVVQRPEWRDR